MFFKELNKIKTDAIISVTTDKICTNIDKAWCNSKIGEINLIRNLEDEDFLEDMLKEALKDEV